MFTGIVEELGKVVSMSDNRLVISCERVMGETGVDSSVSVNGVCLTVVDRSDGTLAFDVTPETLARSSLGGLAADSSVNLERPVTLATRLGGHLVQGHVDGTGKVEAVTANEAGATMTFSTDPTLMRYVVEKGSVTVDGVSLTVASVEGATFTVALIPHTLEMTNLGAAQRGATVNIEVDIMAKYAERLIAAERGVDR
jgi:riboflavin synthase